MQGISQPAKCAVSDKGWKVQGRGWNGPFCNVGMFVAGTSKITGKMKYYGVTAAHGVIDTYRDKDDSTRDDEIGELVLEDTYDLELTNPDKVLLDINSPALVGYRKVKRPQASIYSYGDDKELDWSKMYYEGSVIVEPAIHESSPGSMACYSQPDRHEFVDFALLSIDLPTKINFTQHVQRTQPVSRTSLPITYDELKQLADLGVKVYLEGLTGVEGVLMHAKDVPMDTRAYKLTQSTQPTTLIFRILPNR